MASNLGDGEGACVVDWRTVHFADAGAATPFWLLSGHLHVEVLPIRARRDGETIVVAAPAAVHSSTTTRIIEVYARTEADSPQGFGSVQVPIVFMDLSLTSLCTSCYAGDSGPEEECRSPSASTSTPVPTA